LKGKRAGKAIEKLLRAVAARPDDAETIAVLAEAYLADGNGASAATQATKGLAIPGQEKNVQLLGLAGEGFYAAGQLREARSRFERGLAISKEKGGAGDARITGLLVDTINRQAAERWAADDITGAERLLLEAQAVDPENTRTAFNLGLVAENRGDHETAIKYLSARLARIPGDLVSNRIIAKAYLGMGDEAKAADAYSRAATDAAARRNLTVLAEVYTEWAPLILKSGKAGAVDDAVDKLEQAAQYARGQPFERATKRNLVVAYFRRGYERLRSRRGSDAIEDLEAATKDASLLTGNEPEVFGFALGLAYLDGGQTSKAAAIFQGLSRKGNLSFLKPPFDAVGADFFSAYTLYRDSSPSAHSKAAPPLERLAGKTGGALGAKVKELARSNWEQVAYDANTRGQGREADVALRKASALGAADRRPQIEHNQAVLDADKNPAGARATFTRLTERVPEALINLGILADREGDAKAAFDAWSQARTRGARSPRLDEWLDTKKRIFGF
jgi:tetratricopeptide (TPR) repeat protein